MLLSDIEQLRTELKVGKTSTIKLFHKLLFNTEGDRQNRTRIRNFEGFTFKQNDSHFKAKLDDVLKTFKLLELISIANILHLDIDGTERELANRILSNLCDLELLKLNFQTESDGSDTESESNESSFELPVQSEANRSGNRSDMTVQTDSRNDFKYYANINYGDIESTINKFNAEAHENINVWLENFENMSVLFNLNEIQKFIFAKRSLGGNAALFIRSEPGINSFSKLKTALIDEFAIEINSACLHEMLSKRRMKENETCQQYFLHMKEMAGHGQIDQAALIHYIIKGINDKNENKFMLYGCKTLAEFKEKIKIYDVIKADFAKDDIAFNKTKTNCKMHVNDQKRNYNGHKSSYKNEITTGMAKTRCFSCGEKGHISKDCFHKDNGTKCFKCKEFGHRSFECSETNSKPEVATINVGVDSKLSKVMKIGDVCINSLIDTGSQATLLRKSIFDKLNIGRLQPASSTLSGFEKSQIKPLGFFKSTIEIDNFQCTAVIYVVNDNVMMHEAILGLNVLLQGEISINESGVTIKNKLQSVDEVNVISVLPIDVASNENEISIFSTVPNCFKENIQELHEENETSKRSTEHEGERLSEDNFKLFKRFAELESELAEVKTQLREEECKRANLEQLHLNTVVEASEAKKRDESLKEEINRLNDQLKEESERVHNLSLQLAEEQRFRSREEEKISHIHQRLQQKEEQMKIREDEIVPLKEKCKEQQKQIRKHCKTICILERTNKQLEIDNETLAYKLSKSLDQFDELEDQLRREASHLGRESLYEQISAKENTNSKNNINKILHNRPNSQDPAFRDQVKQLKEESSTLKEQLESVQKQLEFMSMKYQQYREKIYGSRNEYEEENRK